MVANGGQQPPAVYQPTRPGGTPQPNQQPERPSEFQEQFNKIAECTCSISLSRVIHLIGQFYLISREEDFRDFILKS